VRTVLDVEIAPSPAATLYASARAALEPRVLEAMRANPENRSSLSALWAATGQMAEKDQFDRAVATLRKLDDALARLRPASAADRARSMGIEPGLVSQRRAELEEKLRQRVDASHAEVAIHVESLTPELATVIADPPTLVVAIQKYVDGLFDRVAAAVKAALHHDDMAHWRQEIAALRASLSTDPALVALASASSVFRVPDPNVAVASFFDDAFVELERHSS
jgi:hypothetical protein